jgi:HTH-type transcriptional regulator/antitoxin HigA
MTQLVPAEAFLPGEILLDELNARNWTQLEFAEILGRSPKFVNEIIKGETAITPRTAREIAAALGTSPMFWLNLELMYRLHHSQDPIPPRIGHQARLRERFPVHEMIKRRWIEASSDPEVLEANVLRFFGINTLDDEPRLMHAAKKSGYPEYVTGTQRAWLFRVKQVASAMPVKPYSERALREALSELRGLLASVEEVRRVPKILEKCGVRFVIVEHVPSSKIDGVCFWLDGHPVIGMSLRLDRIDNFWFVLRHEIEHILNKNGRDVAVVDRDIVDIAPTEVSVAERRADEAAANFCVPTEEMYGFISRYRPAFSEQKLLGFAQRMNVHPGLVVGQLQRHTRNYKQFRKHLVNIRPIIAPVAMTDGYGAYGSILGR